tara:strand:+ start:510 stop:1124 length:615 start_codon:yes stop_codon:yes gene_type:complete
MSTYNHIAVIPARKNSKGYPKKNRIYFNKTIKFIKSIKWFDKVILSSDDDWFKKKCKLNQFDFLKRNKKLSGPKISIKEVFKDIIKKSNYNSNTIFWLIYIPLLPKKEFLYLIAKKKIESKNIKSLCGFTPALTNPHLTWGIRNKKIFQYIKNNYFRRQDLPKAYTHNHIVCCFKISELKYLNNELLNVNTYPLIVTEKIKEID